MSRTAAPNRIIVAADWHGNTSWALDVISRAEEHLAGEEHRVILHLGDFGIWPGHEGCDYICDVALALAEADVSVFFVDGNHEDHDQLRHDLGSELAIPMGPGLYGDTIRWLPRGHRWEWHGRTWLALGGAVSVDRAIRVKENLGWWPEEEITDEQEARVVAGGPADVMVTHDCPAGVVHAFGPRPPEWAETDLARSERHAQRLQRVTDAVQPSHLMHGHLHMAYQRVCDFGYGPVEVTGLDRDGGRGPNWAVLDVKSMTWEVP